MLGGSTQIIVYLALSLLLHFQPAILATKSNDEIFHIVHKVTHYSPSRKSVWLTINLIRQVTKETADIIVNEAIDLWQEHGGPIGLLYTDQSKAK